MKKRKIILSILALSSLALISCDKKETPKEPAKEETPIVEPEKIVKTYKVTLYDGQTVLAEIDAEENKPLNLEKYQRVGYDLNLYYSPSLDKDELFNLDTIINEDYEALFVKYTLTKFKATFDTDGGNAISDLEYTLNDEKSLPYATKDGFIFKGWYDSNDNLYTHVEKGTTKNLSLKAKYEESKIVKKEFIYDPSLFSTSASDLDSTIFDVSGTLRGRIATWTNPNDSSDSIKFSQNSLKGPNIKFKSPGNGKLSFYVQNGSGGASTQKVRVSKGTTSSEIEFAGESAYNGYNGGSPVVKIEVDIQTNDEITISSVSGTIDIYRVDVNVDVQTTNVTGIKIANEGNNTLYEGLEYDTSSLQLETINGDNLYTEALENDKCFIDTSNVDTKTPGEYEVKVNYYGMEATYNVYVHEANSLELGFDETYQSRNSYNGIYVNGKVKTIYKLNEELNTNYLTTILNTKLVNETESFILDDALVTYSSVDTSTTGEKEVTVSFKTNNKTISTKYSIYVINDTPYKDSNNNYVVTVDKSYTGAIGAQNGTNGNMFTTISEALEFLARTEATSNKILNVKKGYYKEKLEINIPNLTINGEGTCKATYDKDENYKASEYNNATIIEWDSLVLIPDASGYVQVTDSCQTVAVREEAINCTLNNITLSNFWNCEEIFRDNIDTIKKYGLGTGTKNNYTVNEHRALALIVQADKFRMNNCSLLGYQDTVEFMTGRQLIKNTYISGVTDYIFGTNSTTYFYGCEIHSIQNANKGGYTTAYKGTNGTGTEIEYGLIFNSCNFTTDSDAVVQALGRPWGDHTKVMIMNSTISAKYSTSGYNGGSSGTRYVSMSGVEPTNPNVKFLEYNNSGDGAVKSSVTGMTLVSSTVAADYSDFTKIFAQTNGNLKYNDAWNPSLN